MLERAMALSRQAAQARGEIQEGEGRGGGGGGGHSRANPRLRLLSRDGYLHPADVDRKLWRGAAAAGWQVRPRSIKQYLDAKATTRSYFYFAPFGEKLNNRSEAFAFAKEDEGAVAEVAAESDDSDEDGDDADEVVPAVMRLGSGVSAEEAMAQDHAAVLAALERGGESSGDEEDGGSTERCMILGCKHQLLQCYGVKSDAMAAVGCAEESHIICTSCLERWAVAQNTNRAAQGLSKLTRKCCPMCKTELRITKDHRDDASLYHMGLLKVAGTWPAEVSPQRAREPTNFAPAIEEAEVVAVEAVPVAVAAQSSSGTQPPGDEMEVEEID